MGRFSSSWIPSEKQHSVQEPHSRVTESPPDAAETVRGVEVAKLSDRLVGPGRFIVVAQPLAREGREHMLHGGPNEAFCTPLDELLDGHGHVTQWRKNPSEPFDVVMVLGSFHTPVPPNELK